MSNGETSTTWDALRCPRKAKPHVKLLAPMSPTQASELQYGRYAMLAAAQGFLCDVSKMPPSATVGVIFALLISHGVNAMRCWQVS